MGARPVVFSGDGVSGPSEGVRLVAPALDDAEYFLEDVQRTQRGGEETDGGVHAVGEGGGEDAAVEGVGDAAVEQQVGEAGGGVEESAGFQHGGRTGRGGLGHGMIKVQQSEQRLCNKPVLGWPRCWQQMQMKIPVTCHPPVTRSRGSFSPPHMLRTLASCANAARRVPRPPCAPRRRLAWASRPAPPDPDGHDELARATILDKVMQGRQPADLMLRCTSRSLRALRTPSLPPQAPFSMLQVPISPSPAHLSRSLGP